ncbi:putative dinucleotide-binding enzyme [Sinorhizobium fredii]
MATATNNSMSIGIIGAGQIGSAFARALARNGIAATISNSRGPETLQDLSLEMSPHIKTGSIEEAAKVDIVLIAVPLSKLPQALAGLPEWAGGTVIDANNPIEGPLFKPAELNGRLSTEIFASLVPGARVVKAFNHLQPHLLSGDHTPKVQAACSSTLATIRDLRRRSVH